MRGAALAVLITGTGSASADEPLLEVIVVTGSRIARADFNSPSPIVTVPGEAFAQTGAISVDRTLVAYPQFVPTAGATSNAPSNDGQANVSLRGLGANRTLVLLDGRRLMPADGNGSVDLNILPPSLIRSVQVLTGGASAVYGSDAVAGVVNIQFVDAFEGVEFEGSGTLTDQGDGEEYFAGLTAGTSFAADRGAIVGHVGYSRRKAIEQSDRRFSRYPLDYVPGVTDGFGPGGAFLGSGSGITEDGLNVVFSSRPVFDSVFASYGYPPGSAPYQAGIGVNADGTLFTIGNGAAGSVVNFRGERDPVMFNDRNFNVYNFAPDTALLLPLERSSAFLRGTFALTDAVDAYLQALYADYSVERQLAPAAAGIALIPVTNPFIPADLATLLASRTAPSAPYRYWRRAVEVGPQTAENQRDVLQVTAGTRGKFAGEWAFDLYAQFGQNDRSERQTNNVSLSQLQNLAFAPDGGASICSGGFNPYVAGSLSSDCARYVAVDAANAITLRQSLAEASVTGPLWSLPAGDLSAAFGLLYKRDEFEYDADAALSRMLPGVPGVIGPRPDIAGFPAAPDRAGDASNTDAYLELRAPVLKERPGAQLLELGLGYRYSDYSQVGSVNSYKADLLYRPVSPLRLRGSYQHAVRAPSIEELYFPPVSNQFIVPMPEPCDANSPARTGPDRARVEALCLAQGVPAALLPNFDFELRRVDGIAGGNPDLESEQADTYTVGFTLTSMLDNPRIRDLQLSVDWYQITIDDGIGRWDSESAVARCFDPKYNPAYDDGNVYCSFFTRDVITGNIFAQILDRNIGGLETAGVDVQFDWGFAAGPGKLGLNGLLTYVDYWTYLDPSGFAIDYAGTVGGGGLGRSLPRWKSLLNVSYALGELGLMARWQHIDGMRDVEYRDFEVPAYDYVDVGASYAFEAGPLHGLHARVGIDNVFDQAPPIFPTWQQANTDPSLYDVLGRRYYLRLTYAFR